MVKFSIKRKTLIDTLKHLGVAMRHNPVRNQVVNCEITVKTGLIELVVPGAFYTIDASTSGVAKVSLPFLYLKNIIETLNDPEITVLVGQNTLTFGDLTVAAKTTFIKDDSILKRIALPINYNIKDILNLPSQYTQEELDFNGMTTRIYEAKAQTSKTIDDVFGKLNIYGVSRDEIVKLVESSLGISLNTVS